MVAVAGIWLAIGLALFSICAFVVFVLCHMALRHGKTFEGEIKAPSFSLKISTRAPADIARATAAPPRRAAREGNRDSQHGPTPSTNTRI